MACYFIEPGWEKVFQTEESVWISRKSRTEGSFHGDVKRKGNQIVLEDDNTFKGSLTANKILSLNWANQKIKFLAPQKTFDFKKPITSLDVSKGGLGVFSSGEKVYVFDTQDGVIRREFTEHVAELYQCKMFPSGIVGLSYGADMQLKIWSCTNGKCPVTLAGHTKAVTCTSIIERGRNIASVSKDGTARIWNCGSSKCIGQVDVGEILNTCTLLNKTASDQGMKKENEGVDSELEGKLLVVGGEEGGVYAADLATQSIINRFKCSSAVNCIITTKGQLVTGCDNGEVLIFDHTDLGKPSRTIHVSNSPVLALLELDVGFLVGRADGTATVHLNHTNTLLYLTGPDNERVSSLSKDDEYIYTGSRDGSIRKYSLENTMVQ